MKKFLLIVSFFFITSPAFSFALISPQRIEIIAQKKDQYAKSMINYANSSLTAKPHAISYIHTEGTLPHEGIWDQSIEATQDWRHVLNLAVAYRLTGDAKYLTAAENFFLTWTINYQPSFNPIDETNFDQVIIAYDLTRDKLPPTTQNELNNFLREMAKGYISAMSDPKRRSKNNWQSHRVKLATLAAYAANDAALIQSAHKAFTQQIADNILSDGSTLDFQERDAIDYVNYNLEPLLTAAIAGKMHGENWFEEKNLSGTSLKSAVDWLLPYAQGTMAHEEFVNTKVKFDKTRKDAGLPGYSGKYDPVRNIKALTLASIVDPSYKKIADEVVAKNGKKPTPLFEVLFW